MWDPWPPVELLEMKPVLVTTKLNVVRLSFAHCRFATPEASVSCVSRSACVVMLKALTFAFWMGLDWTVWTVICAVTVVGFIWTDWFSYGMESE